MHLKLISTAFVALSLGTASAHAQVQAKFVVDGLANCTRPYLRNYPIHIEGSGTLRPDRTADLAVTGNVENTNYAVKLGRRATEVEAGTASLRVAGRRSLRATARISEQRDDAGSQGRRQRLPHQGRAPAEAGQARIHLHDVVRAGLLRQAADHLGDLQRALTAPPLQLTPRS